jgi:Trypsin
MMPRNGNVRSAPYFLFAAAILATLQGAAALAQGLSPEALRAAQTGLVRDFSNLPPSKTLAKANKEIASSAIRKPGLSGLRVELNFTGGVHPPKNSFTELAKIEFLDNLGRSDRCTGIFLDEEIRLNHTVLTAAHCSCGQLNSYRVFKGDNAEQHKTQTLVLSAPPSRYGGYSCESPVEDQIGRDLAILRVEIVQDNGVLQAPLPFRTSTVTVANMHQIYRDNATRRLVGVGFGRTEAEELPQDAVAAIIPIRSFFCAAGFFAASPCASFREFVLADPAAGSGNPPADSCGGDSGAPIFWVPPATDKDPIIASSKRFLVGITSRALDGVRHTIASSCGAGGIYTAIGHPDVVRWLALHGVMVRTEFK